MVSTGSKWFFGLGLVSFVLAACYGWTTGGNGLGPLSLGYKGGVGDHLGYGILVAGGFVSVFLGVVAIVTRDAEAEAVAQAAGTDAVPPVIPAGTSYWPALSAFGAALVVIGLVSEALFFVFGLIVLGIVLVEWTVQTWADHATGDPETNRQIRNRLMNPIEFPLAAILGLGLLAIGFSRIFLALTNDQTVLLGVVITVLVVAVGFVVASRPRLSANLIVGLLVALALHHHRPRHRRGGRRPARARRGRRGDRRGGRVTRRTRPAPAQGARMRTRRRRLMPLAVLMPLVLFVSACAKDAPQTTLEPQGPIARSIDSLWNGVFLIAAIVFVLVEFGTIFLLAKFRQRKDDDPEELPAQTHGNMRLEIVWTIVPAVMLAIVGFFTLRTLFDVNQTDHERHEGPGHRPAVVVGVQLRQQRRRQVHRRRRRSPPTSW